MKIKDIKHRNKILADLIFGIQDVQIRSKVFKCFSNVSVSTIYKYEDNIEFNLDHLNNLYYEGYIGLEFFDVLKHIVIYDYVDIQTYLLYSPKKTSDIKAFYKKFKDNPRYKMFFDCLLMSAFNRQKPNPYPIEEEYFINFDTINIQYFEKYHKDIYKRYEKTSVFFILSF